MRRAIDALREWLQLRARMRGEHQFHLAQSTEEFRALGLSSLAATRAARDRFGHRRNLTIALRELGGDLLGLAHLFRVHRVSASPWLQPAVLLTAILLILLSSPAPRPVLEGILGQPLASRDREMIFISVQARNRSYVGITDGDFEVLRSVASLTGVEHYRGIHARARAAKGATLVAIESEVQTKTGNPRLRVASLFERSRILMEPVTAVSAFLACCAVFFLRVSLVQFGKVRRWLIYGFVVAGLHALASMTAWALAIQAWGRVPWSTDGRAVLGFLGLMAAYLGIVAIQWRYWWRDLHRRCPACLDGLLLPLTDGTRDRVLLNSATTESVCPHGHGVLVENRWSRRFRPQESPLQGLIGV
jgi:PAS domain-containing protein